MSKYIMLVMWKFALELWPFFSEKINMIVFSTKVHIFDILKVLVLRSKESRNDKNSIS
jgi:hypothetical protein